MNAEIIGNGLIGKSLIKQLALFKDFSVVIIAAGVSSSSCVDAYEFEREIEMVKKQCQNAAKKNQMVVYLSSYSIHQQVSPPSKYIQNKLTCEQFVLGHSEQNIILRLTNIVGPGGNQSNILNYLFHQVTRGKRFFLWKNAHRNFIDVDDVPLFLKFILEKDPKDSIIEMVHPQSYSIIDTVGLIENFTRKSAVFKIEDGHSNTFKQNLWSDQFFNQKSKVEIENNLEKLLSKYF